MEGDAPEEAMLFPTTVGDKLRSARIASGLELAEIAARTRIPQRHLEAIEASDYSGLPSITYAMGFAKAYARSVGVDEVGIAKQLRAELERNYDRAPPHQVYETNDPARVPPSGIATLGGVLALLILIGVGLWYGTGLFRGSPPVVDVTPLGEPSPAASVAAETAPATGGQVSLTATDAVWLRIYDAKGKTLFEKTMQTGERYDVPPDADHPMINIGRPDKITVAVNGSNVAPLGPAARAIKDVGVSAEALLARGASPAPAASPSPSAPQPAARPSPTPSPSPRPSASVPARPAPVSTPRPTSRPTPRPTASPHPGPAASAAPAPAPATNTAGAP